MCPSTSISPAKSILPLAIILPVNVDTPVILTPPVSVTLPLESILTLSLPAVWREIVSLAGNLIFVFESPVWYIVSAMSISPAKVAVSDTLRTSKSVCPSTSKFPLASILPVNVETPAILTLSRLVWPSTSISPLRSIWVAVTIPATILWPPVIGPAKFDAVIIPEIGSIEMVLVPPG